MLNSTRRVPDTAQLIELFYDKIVYMLDHFHASDGGNKQTGGENTKEGKQRHVTAWANVVANNDDECGEGEYVSVI